MISNTLVARHWISQRPFRLVWRDGRLADFACVNADAPPDLFFAPALFDTQINGYAGVDFQRDNLGVAELLRATRALRRDGCARFLLTLITDEWPRLTARLRHLRAVRDRHPELRAAIVGWHIEGPFLSAEPGFCGAHNPEWMLDPLPRHLTELRRLTGHDPVLLTLAPERRGALRAIRLAVRLGFRVSLGHTNASAARLAAAIKAGATGFTHLGNGCPHELCRSDNILWRVLDTGGLTVSLIPDGRHVVPELFRLIHRLLPGENIHYTTDAMSAAAAPPGRHPLGRLWVEVGPDRVVRLPGTAYFAGSSLRPIEAIHRAAAMLGCSWVEAWKGISRRAARFAGFDTALQPGSNHPVCLIKISAGGEPQILKTFGPGSCRSGETSPKTGFAPCHP